MGRRVNIHYVHPVTKERRKISHDQLKNAGNFDF